MPLLRRQPFVREPIPEDLEPSEELFHCKLTNEVFRDYEAFFERVILCNSLVWTCELTGKPCLTYLEALKCEERARVVLSTLTVPQKRAMLCLATYVKRTRLGDLCDDVFGYMKDRFFVGEDVETVVKGERRSSVVVKVLPPHSNNSALKSGLVNGNSHLNTEESENEIDPSMYRYQVRETAGTKGPTHVVTFVDIMRKKGTFTREKNKLFLKQACEPKKGNWVPKDKFIKKYGLDSSKFRDIFTGVKPIFSTRRSASSSTKKEKIKIVDDIDECIESVLNDGGVKKTKRKQSNEDSKKRGLSKADAEKEPPKEVAKKMTEEERMKAKEEQKQKLEERRQKRREEKLQEREKQREERRIFAQCLREWQKPRDDLECDDLMDLPTPVPVLTPIPNELFGEMISIMEFVHDFYDFLWAKYHFPQGLTLNILKQALTTADVQGPFNDLLHMLLTAVFRIQDDSSDDDNDSESSSSSPFTTDDSEHKAALLAANWAVQTHGLSLKKLDLDAFTLSEILRLHLSSAGVCVKNKNYVNRDDGAFQFRLVEKDLLAKLCVVNVFDLQPSEKIKIVNALVGQLMCSEFLKEDIEDNIERLRSARYDYRHFQWAEQRREREAATLRNKKKQEERNAAQAEGGAGGSTKEDVPEPIASVDDEDQTVERMELRLREGQKRDKEMSDLVNKYQNRGIVQVLGRDRAFRRFWMFNSLPGLFVEDDDDTIGPCLLNPTPYNPNSNPYVSFNQSVSEARHRAQNIAQGNNKENVINGTIGKNHKPMAADVRPATVNGAIDATGGKNKSMPTFGMCNTLGDKCPVHGSVRQQTRWAFYPTSTYVESLIAALNPRGFREGSLKEVLVAEKKKVLQSVSKCPVADLNDSVAGGDQVSSKSKVKSEPSKQQVSGNSSCESAMELILRDSLVELEEKIYAASLGCIKTDDRKAWQNKLLNHDESKEEKSSGSQNVVSELSSALSQIYHSVEPKYLISPLGTSSEQESSSGGKTKSSSVKWEEALMSSTSLSQVFLHLSSLERSIAWSKSILNARCRICRRKGDAEHMLLCDSCDRGHHIYCLKPKLTEIPEGEWMCADCSPKPKATPSGKRKQVRFDEGKDDDEDGEVVDQTSEGNEDFLSSEEEDEESLDDDDDDVDVSGSDVEEEEDVEVQDEEQVEEEDEQDEDDEVEESGVSKTKMAKRSNICCKCGNDGELLTCSDCGALYHPSCTKPPMRRVPRGIWCCSDCSSVSKGVTAGGSHSSRENSPLAHGSRRAHLRRSERKVKRVQDYSTHTKDDSDYEVGEPGSKRLRRTTRRMATTDISDEEWYGLVRRQTPPIRRGASDDVPLDFRTCDQLLTELVRHEDGWPFLKPVTRKEVPNYYDIIKRPVDFGTIRSKLNRMVYPNNKAFVVDVLLVFQNCCLFNPYASLEFHAAVRLGWFFVRRLRESRLNLLSEEVLEVTKGDDDCGHDEIAHVKTEEKMEEEDEEEQQQRRYHESDNVNNSSGNSSSSGQTMYVTCNNGDVDFENLSFEDDDDEDRLVVDV